MVNGKYSDKQITHEAKIKFRLGEELFEEWFLVNPELTDSCDLLLGRKWLEKYDPTISWKTQEILEYKELQPGQYQINLPKGETWSNYQPIIKNYNENWDSTPLAQSQDAFAAFQAGGVSCAIEAETQRRQQVIDQYREIIRLQTLVQEKISELKETKAFAATLNGDTMNSQTQSSQTKE